MNTKGIIDTYRSKDGKHYYCFRFVPKSNYYDIDIVSMPDYGKRSKDAITTHRLSSERGGQRICLTNATKAAPSLAKAKEVAMAWAEFTTRYINTGKKFHEK